MKLGIMQPYLFPYIGYFQLMNAVDKFVVYDDVNFIKQGWINKNRILLNNAAYTFSVPLKNASSFVQISNTFINDKMYDHWKKKFFKTLEQAYFNAPFFKTISEAIKAVFENNSTSIAQLALSSIEFVCTYLDINTKIVRTSSVYNNQFLNAENRVIDLCKKENAQVYVNAAGGITLYSGDNFLKEGIQLYFLKSGEINYRQFNNEFIPFLSMIDVLMFNSKTEIASMLGNFELMCA
jgi:hypothetical protein